MYQQAQASGLPLATGLPGYQPRLPIMPGNARHIAQDHPERWLEVGILPQQVIPRLAAAGRDLAAAGRDLAAAAGP